MNIIGDFGKFMIRYQNQIEFFLILLAVILAVVFIIRTVLGERRKRTLLSQIHDTVSDIHAAVSHMDNQKPDVIYIDNRTADRASKESPISVSAEDCRQDAVSAAAACAEAEMQATHAAMQTDGAAEGTDSASEAPAAFSDDTTETALRDCSENHLTDDSPEEENTAEIPRKYTNLECGISKNGKIYTVEELQRQIKE